MKIKGLAVIALLALGCSFASAQSFGFMSVSGGLYCNYVQLAPFAGAVLQGAEVIYLCGMSSISITDLVAAKGGLTQAGNPAGFRVHGVVFADDIYDAFALSYTGAQWFVAQNLKCSKKHYGWIGLASISGAVFFSNYGYLSCTLPTGYGKGPSTGQYPKASGGKQRVFATKY